jgi:hypothetical protein
MQLLYIMYKYSSNSIAFASEVGIVAAGPIANIVVFMVMVLAGAMFYRVRLSPLLHTLLF